MKLFKRVYSMYPASGYPDIFTENNPPPYYLSKDFKWWYEGYVLRLPVFGTIEDDFWTITRIK